LYLYLYCMGLLKNCTVVIDSAVPVQIITFTRLNTLLNERGTHRTVRQIAMETGIAQTIVHRVIRLDLKLKCFNKARAHRNWQNGTSSIRTSLSDQFDSSVFDCVRASAKKMVILSTDRLIALINFSRVGNFSFRIETVKCQYFKNSVVYFEEICSLCLTGCIQYDWKLIWFGSILP